MPPDTEEHPPYYYVKGEKVPLVTAVGVVSVDSNEIDAKLSSTLEAQEIKSASRALRGGILLVNEHSVSESASQSLQDNEVGRAVFEIEGGYLVPLPEVRIEDDDELQLFKVASWLKQHLNLAEVVSERPGRIVVKPVSGNPLDALAIANQITEQLNPEMAQIRFLRLVNRPSLEEKPHRSG